MAIDIEPPEPDLTNIRKHLGASRPLWRLFGWGGAAALALSALALVSQTETGSQQIQLALAGGDARAVTVAVAEPPARKPEKDAETQRLEAQVRELAADRDRLATRIASLERNLDDMTGSIKRQAERIAVAPPAPAPVVEPPAPNAVIAAMSPPPIVASPAPPVIEPLAMPALDGSSAAGWPDSPRLQQPDGIEAVPLPPTRVAVAPAAVDPPAPAPPPVKNEIGIDLGSAPNMEVLRLRWAAVKANYGPLLGGLSPLAVPVHRGNVTEIRLVVGPLPNLAAARALCARFAEARVGCRTARFDGQKLAQQ